MPAKTYSEDYFTGEMHPCYLALFDNGIEKQTPSLDPHFFPAAVDAIDKFEAVGYSLAYFWSTWPSTRVVKGTMTMLKSDPTEVLRALSRQITIILYFSARLRDIEGISSFDKGRLCANDNQWRPFPIDRDANKWQVRPTDFEEWVGGAEQFHIDQTVWRLLEIIRRAADVATWICSSSPLPQVPGLVYSNILRASNEMCVNAADAAARNQLITEQNIVNAVLARPGAIKPVRLPGEIPPCPEGIGESVHADLWGDVLKQQGRKFSAGALQSASPTHRREWLQLMAEYIECFNSGSTRPNYQQKV